MAASKSELAERYPLPVYNYRVTIGGKSLGFSEVAGLQIEFEHKTYRHGLSFREGELIAKHRIEKFTSITLKRGMTRSGKELTAWLAETEFENMDISLCNESGTPVVTWHAAKVLPVKLEGPSFQADTNEVAIESLEVMASGLSVEHHAG